MMKKLSCIKQEYFPLLGCITFNFFILFQYFSKGIPPIETLQTQELNNYITFIKEYNYIFFMWYVFIIIIRLIRIKVKSLEPEDSKEILESLINKVPEITIKK